MPNSRFALHGRCPSLIHGLCAFFASSSQFVRLFQAALDAPLDSPFSVTLSVHGLHFTVCAPSNSSSSDCRKRGVEFKGGGLHDNFGGFDGWAVLESTLSSFCLSYKIQHNEATVAGFDGFGGHGGFSHDGYPP